MSYYATVEQKCQFCNGTGALPQGGSPGPLSCPYCLGVGWATSHRIDLGDIKDELDDIKDKCDDIFEKVSA